MQTDAGEGGRQLDRDRAVPAAGAAHGVADRQAQRLPAGPQGHRRGEGRDAQGAPRRRPARPAPPRRARRVQRDAVRGDDAGGRVAGLADGPTEVHKITLARQLLKEYDARRHACSRPPTSPPAASRPGRTSPSASSSTSPSCRAWLTAACVRPVLSVSRPWSGRGGPSTSSGAGGGGPRCRGRAGGA